MISKRLMLSLIACLMTVNVLAASPELPPPFLLVEDSWPPYARPDGKGLSNSIVRHAYRAVGLEPRIEVRPYARVLAEVEHGQADGCFNVTRQNQLR